jgi:hypothetical protein
LQQLTRNSILARQKTALTAMRQMAVAFAINSAFKPIKFRKYRRAFPPVQILYTLIFFKNREPRNILNSNN